MSLHLFPPVRLDEIDHRAVSLPSSTSPSWNQYGYWMKPRSLKLIDNGGADVVFPQARFAITDEVAKGA